MYKSRIIALFLLCCILLGACTTTAKQPNTLSTQHPSFVPGTEEPEYIPSESPAPTDDGSTVYLAVPEYAGEPYVIINENEPYFTKSDITATTFEEYSDLDEFGRCGIAFANLSRELMPTEDREDISDVIPSGFINRNYDGEYLYNRCHLIGFQLAGENANELNLITGTRYMNVEGMLPFENMVADYIKETDNHVLYRVTPIYEGDNLVADGVLMEATSIEDNGDGINFCVYCYNVSGTDVIIDYTTGDSYREGDTAPDELADYILNTNSMKFHKPDCSGAAEMSAKNRLNTTDTRQNLIAQGYSPCGICG